MFSLHPGSYHYYMYRVHVHVYVHVHCICLPKQVPGCFPDPLGLGLLAEDEPTIYMYISFISHVHYS